MKRRTFLRTSAAAAAAAPIVLGGVPLRANTTLEALAQMPSLEDDRALVIIQLFGGNDGLNTLIPALDDNYYRIRPGIGIPKEDAWNGIGDVYLSPNLGNGPRGGFGQMLLDGTLAIVQGVGYDNPNLSHFRSTDIWLSGINESDPNVRLDTGWIGRWLEARYPDFPTSLPDHPLAVQLGGSALTLLGTRGRMGIEMRGAASLEGGFAPPADTLDDLSGGTAYEFEYEFIADIAGRSNRYADAVNAAYQTGNSMLRGSYADNGFARQMATVASLIAGGLKSKVYVVSMTGFDTHVTQQTDPLYGTHPTLLGTLANAVAEFQYDMVALGHGDRVVGMTVSEFGRRPYENGSFGTDHGAASVLFVFGTQVNSGVFGNPPDLVNFNSNGDLEYSVDYRQVYAEVLTDWFAMSTEEMRQVLREDTLLPVDVLQRPSSVSNRTSASGPLSITGAWPNPFRTSTSVEYRVPSAGPVTVELTDVRGSRRITLVDRALDAGTHTVRVSGDHLPSGVYALTVRSAGLSATQMLRHID